MQVYFTIKTHNLKHDDNNIHNPLQLFFKTVIRMFVFDSHRLLLPRRFARVKDPTLNPEELIWIVTATLNIFEVRVLDDLSRGDTSLGVRIENTIDKAPLQRNEKFKRSEMRHATGFDLDCTCGLANWQRGLGHTSWNDGGLRLE